MIYAYRAWQVVWDDASPAKPIPLEGESLADYFQRTYQWITTPITRTYRLAPVSAFVPSAWHPRQTTTAECGIAKVLPSRFGDHAAPESGCTCGLWGTNDLTIPMLYVFGTELMQGWQLLGPGISNVLGVVGLWGRIVPHRDGWRAQYGQPIALAQVHDNAPYQQLSEQYDIPVFPDAGALRREFHIDD